MEDGKMKKSIVGTWAYVIDHGCGIMEMEFNPDGTVCSTTFVNGEGTALAKDQCLTGTYSYDGETLNSRWTKSKEKVKGNIVYKDIDDISSCAVLIRDNLLWAYGDDDVTVYVRVSDPSLGKSRKEMTGDEMFKAGIAYMGGKGTENDLRSEYWLTRAAWAGSQNAQSWLGSMYVSGGRFGMDEEQGIRYLEKAIKQGNTSAKYELDNYYKNKKIRKRRIEETIAWCKKAKEKDLNGMSPVEIFKEARMHYSNLLVEGEERLNVEKVAIKWMTKAAEAGLSKAQWTLGDIYIYNPRYENYNEAIKWLTLAAEQGYAPADYYLARCYENGWGVAKSQEEAEKWERKAELDAEISKYKFTPKERTTLELKGRYCKDCKIFTDDIEPGALSIIYQFLDNPMFEGSKIRIMPDVHAGNDIVVGFTVPFTGHVNPDHVGGDIGCSVSTSILDLKVNPEDYPAIEGRIREKVRLGTSIQPHAVFTYSELFENLQKRLSESNGQWPEMVDMVNVTESGITDILKRIDMREYLFYNSIGTVGGGNHFVELGKTLEGNYAVTVHCGSRNFGQKVWKYWKNIADSDPDSRYGFLTGKAMRGYLTDMVLAQAYAEYNHTVIHRLIVNAISETCGRKVNVVRHIHTAHNYIDFSMRILRKGAVSAKDGQELVIPFNMRDGLIIARGKGNADWNYSAPHGAGRLMSRSDAKSNLSMDEFRSEMKDVYSTSVKESTIDESPMAYKNTGEIIQLIKPTVEIVSIVKPVINLKA